MIAYFFSPNVEANVLHQWDAGLLMDFIQDRMWRPSNYEDFAIKECQKIPKTKRALVAIPARHNADHIDFINEQLANIDRLVLFLMGDEESVFDVSAINHPNCAIWVQNPRPGVHDDYNKLGTGYPPQCTETLAEVPYGKDLDMFFSGQLTHERRYNMWDAIKSFELGRKCKLEGTNGFTQGMPHQEYYSWFARSRTAPAPSGAVLPDSFRFFEAMESMSLVIADEKNPAGDIEQYWEWLFGEVLPVMLISDWAQVGNYAREALDDWDRRVQQQTCWWIKWKRNFAYKVMEQLLV